MTALALERSAQRVLARRVAGKVSACIGLTIEATGLEQQVVVGDEVEIETSNGSVQASVTGFARGVTFLMPLAETVGVSAGCAVCPRGASGSAQVQDPNRSSLGRICNAAGTPLDQLGPIPLLQQLDSRAPQTLNPLHRKRIDRPLDVGVRSLNSLLTVGRGQRLGLFAGSGVGKSVLLGMIARYTDADVVIVGLIGERSREVREFVEENLGEGLRKSIVVVSPADDPPALRAQGAELATRLAECYRDQGLDVLLLLDSLTRVAQARREIGLSMGEPPATKGYPPSVFAAIPRLVERAGCGEQGSITAFYTVLMEEDDLQDPVVDSARAILDGHVVLDRRLAELGQYPAVNIAASVSRLARKLQDEPQRDAALQFKALWARYQEQQDLVSVGAYESGTDPLLDRALELREPMHRLLCQGEHEACDFNASRHALLEVLASPEPQGAVPPNQVPAKR